MGDDGPISDALTPNEEQLPSFGNRLDRFRATPPSRRSPRRAAQQQQPVDDVNDIEDVNKRSLERQVRKSTSAIHIASSNASPLEDVNSPSPASPSVASRKAASLTPAKRKTPSAKGADSDNSSPFLSSTSGSAKKQRRVRQSGDHGQYEGMPGIPDRIACGLDILFCGINPGVRSSEAGFHYAHPSNRFYRILHESGLTPHRLKPSESAEMPARYKLGLTDLVLRCTARADQVPSMEFQAGATTLLKKIIQYKPKLVCFVGMDVYRNFRRHFAEVKGILPDKNSAAQSPASKARKSVSDVALGLQPLELRTDEKEEDESDTYALSSGDKSHITRLFVIPSTSGLAAGYSDSERVELLKEAKRIATSSERDMPVHSVTGAGYPSSGGGGVAVVVNAKDFLEDRIVKSSTGQWVQRVP